MPQFRRLGFRRRVEHGRDVPAPLDLVRDLEMNHRPREASLRRVNDSLSRLSRATAYTGRFVAVTDVAGIDGTQACPKGLRHGFGIAAVAARGTAANGGGRTRPRRHCDDGELHDSARRRGAGGSRS